MKFSPLNVFIPRSGYILSLLVMILTHASFVFALLKNIYIFLNIISSRFNLISDTLLDSP